MTVSAWPVRGAGLARRWREFFSDDFPDVASFGLSRKRETMENAAHNRISRLLPLVTLVGLAFTASTVSAGVNVWTTNGPTGGDILALAIDPSSPATVYAGTADGRGIFKSSNGGQSWSLINTGLADPPYPVAPTVLDLAIDPSAPATLYAGTFGRGVFKSTNGGESWSPINTGLISPFVRGLAIDSSNPATLYAGTVGSPLAPPGGSGIFKSINGGGSWTAVNTGLTNTDVSTLAIDPTNAATIYAASGAGVFKSTNGGGSWSPINSGLTATSVDALVIDPSAPATLYAGTFGGGVFKSTDGGGSWSPINTGLTNPLVQVLAIDPSAPATLYAGTFGGGGVFKSTDRGGSWSPINTGMTLGFVNALAIDHSAPATLYADAGSFGVFKSTNGGASWTFPSAQLSYSQVNALVIDPSTPDTLYAATDSFDYGRGVFKSTDGGRSWTNSLINVSGYALAIDPSTPTTIYAGTWFPGGVHKSTNGGGSWSPVNTGLAFTGDDGVLALVIDPSTPATLYTGTSHAGVFKSTNGGGSWTAINAGLTVTRVGVLAIDPLTPATLYAGTSLGVFKSTNGGESWSAINAGLINPAVRALAVDPANSATLYAGTSGGGVFKSTNGGASWTSMNAGLTNLFVNALAIDPSTPSRVYAGTDGGVFEYLTIELPIDRRILPVVGSTPGANGTFFRTSVQLNNPGSAPMAGRIVFHPSGAAGSDTDPALSYSLAPGQTQSIADLLPAMGVSGVGSADIEIISGAAPVATARVFNDAGASGTTGFTEEAMRTEDALRPGQTGVLLIPSDLTAARFNVGVRSLDEGASLTFTLRNAAGAVLGSTTRAFPPNYHEQQGAMGFLGVLEVPPGGSIAIAVTSGSAILYGATVDNSTGDPSLQIARAAP
jgi:photosystem II stability/assembly factor-like uncharacterized protein